MSNRDVEYADSSIHDLLRTHHLAGGRGGCICLAPAPYAECARARMAGMVGDGLDAVLHCGAPGTHDRGQAAGGPAAISGYHLRAAGLAGIHAPVCRRSSLAESPHLRAAVDHPCAYTRLGLD